ncbi:MAG: Glucose dehydrogenase, PQQ-dependent, partial [uncultured Thermomicrobiales bacterium]
EDGTLYFLLIFGDRDSLRPCRDRRADGPRRRDDARAPARRRQGAGELAASPPRLRGDPLRAARPDQPRERERPQGRLDDGAGRRRGGRHLDPRRPRGHAHRRGRLPLRHRRLGLGLQGRRARRQRPARLEDGPQDGPRLGRRRRLLRGRQSRRGAVGRQGRLAHAGRAPDRDQQGDRRRRLAAPARRPGQGRGGHGRAADREGHGDHRRGRGRVRHPRLARGHRPQDRQGGLAHPHHPRQGRARPRDLEVGARHGLERRRLHLGDGQLRSGHEHDHLGRGQPGSGLGRRVPAGRQPLHRQHARARRRHRQDQVALPAHAERPVRLRQRGGARAGRPARGPEGGAPRQPQRLRLRGRPQRRPVPLGLAVRQEGFLDQGPRPRDRQAGRVRPEQADPALPRQARPAEHRGDDLPGQHGRQELAADRLPPGPEALVHPGDRELQPDHQPGGEAGRLQAPGVLHRWRAEAARADHRQRDGDRRHDRQGGRQARDLLPAAGRHPGHARARLHRHALGRGRGAGRQDPGEALGVSHRLRRERPADDLHGRRQAARRDPGRPRRRLGQVVHRLHARAEEDPAGLGAVRLQPL